MSLYYPQLYSLNCRASLYQDDRFFDPPLSRRLAFHEFGTCLGIPCRNPDEKWTSLVLRKSSPRGWENSDLLISTSEQLQAVTMLPPRGYLEVCNLSSSPISTQHSAMATWTI